ncbi:dihydrofolate reductase [Paenibacillus sp. OV219]|uniref:dihydrofolate reductase n=1 Tax=Paenibacillus sp. OV219 TaxID=1884377 RepID=UPI0008B92D36|nr:dihydrofolate reductase [Paenibacillus sp. OV219]SEM85093.1 dihydrofolate reductase [Paenibacillus sp. OV219]
MTITMIAAMAQGRVIGVDNGMPWHLPAEMAHFRRSTLGRTVIMGRKTFESFGSRPLPKRRNIILTRSHDFAPEGCEVVHSIEEALTKYSADSGNNDELMVIGGTEIYKQFLPYADKLLLTEVEADVAGDAHFPEFSLGEWSVMSREPYAKDEKNAYDFEIVTYVRN